MADVHVKGMAELGKFMDELPIKMRANVARGALRAGLGVIKPAAQANIRSVSGELARGLKIGTRTRGSVVVARLRATGKHAFVAGWIEFGTAAHTITAKMRKGLSIGGLFFQSVNHPGARPRPFLRPAVDKQGSAAVVAVAEYVKNRLATKHGIDTAGILIEGDEP